MKLIDRYLGRQILLSAFFAVLVLSIVLVLGSIFKYILAQLVDRPDLDLGFVAEILLNVLPFSLAITIPWGFLTAILLVFGRLSADNELVSLRMAGLSTPRICLSVALLALAFTGLCGWIKLSVEPAARHKLERMLPDMLYNLASKNPLALFTDRQVMKEIPGYLIFAEREEDHLKHFQMVVLDKTSRPQVFVIAKRVNVGLDPEAETPTMLMDLRDAYFELTSPDGEFSEMQPYAARSAPMPVGLDTLRDAQRKMKPETLQTPEILREIRNPEHKKDVVSSLKTEVSMRFAFSFACVTLGLIGVPLGITAQRRETSVGFALSLLVGIAYFLLMTIVEMMRENNSIRPYYLAWLPNLLFIGLGVYLFRRLAKK